MLKDGAKNCLEYRIKSLKNGSASHWLRAIAESIALRFFPLLSSFLFVSHLELQRDETRWDPHLRGVFSYGSYLFYRKTGFINSVDYPK